MPNFTITADTDLTAGKPKRLASWHFRATVAAVVYLRNGSVTGDIIVPIQLATNTTASQTYGMGEGRIFFQDGLYVDVVSGTVLGSVQLV